MRNPPFKRDDLISIGILAMQCGKRPSELFEWNEEDEWIERLIFDLEVVGLVLAEQNKSLGKYA